MGNTKVITYECEQCGSEVVVTSTGEGQMSPIYCCGIEVKKIGSTKKKPAKSKKKAPVKGSKKAGKKKVAAKKKTAKK